MTDHRIGWRYFVFCMAAFATLSAGPAESAPRICSQLEAELAGKPVRGPSRQAVKYEQAVKEQRQQLSIARSNARRAGCGRTLREGSSSACEPLIRQIAQMETNLTTLEKRLRQMSGSRGRSRAAILADLRNNGCTGQMKEARGEPGGSFLARLFGGSKETQPERASARPTEPARTVTRIMKPRSTTVIGPSGQFATMCVRLCDGYYFPISSSSKASDFARDQKNCETACPGAEVRLYYRKMDSDTADAMVSVAGGAPYSDLPTAYLYRDPAKSTPRACGCTATTANSGYSIIAGFPDTDRQDSQPTPARDEASTAHEADEVDAGNVSSVISLPLPNENEAGPSANVQPAQEASPAEGKRRIRVVGPVFLPDPEEAIDLRGPDRTSAQ